jgi:hypothetical protein
MLKFDHVEHGYPRRFPAQGSLRALYQYMNEGLAGWASFLARVVQARRPRLDWLLKKYFQNARFFMEG